ncbi:MAG: sigma-70 family RNA polymerase sigma factor [Planctomycetes bacterium]|nr:sigma-70 family RNA polymerase sigma factor [Planctomycetota bacterium]
MPDDLHQQLQQHAQALRGLARDLLRCDHAADDVTQATMQQALARRDLRPGPLGGWLQRTLVNFVRQWRRGERRRLAREAAVATTQPVPAVADQLARRELLQRVTDAVLGLDEPYQTAVFLRYFENLPPRAIARRTGTNLATVKSRLARGLGMLRTRLDRGDRDGRSWRPAMLFTFGLPLPASLAAGALPAGALLMSTTPKVLVAVGALCVGGWFWLGPADPTRPTKRGDDDARTADAAALAQGPSRTDESTSERTGALPAGDAIAGLDHPFVVTLEVLVVDPLGLPIEGHTPVLGPLGCARNDANATTGPDGRVVLQWPTRRPQITIELADPRGQVRRLTLRHDQPNKVTLLGNRKGGGTVLRLSGTMENAARLEGLATSVDFFGTYGSGGRPSMHEGLHPAVRFGDDRAQTVESGGIEIGGVALGRVLYLDGASFDLRGLAESQPAAGDVRAIAGTVFGSDGKPAAKVAVALLGTSPQPIERTETDEHGAFRFEGMAPGEFTVRAGGDAQGLATASATAAAGTTPVTLHLQLGSCIRGTARAPNGTPLAKALVEWRALDESWADVTEVADDGTFVLANLPGGPGQVLLLPPDGARRLPLAVAPSVLPDTAGLELCADLQGPGAIAVEPIRTPSDGRPQVRVVHVETGLIADIQPPAVVSHDGDLGASIRVEQPRWTMVALPAGFYEVDLRVATGGARSLGSHWCDGNGPVDLGRVELPPPGLAQFHAAEGVLPTDPDQHEVELVALRQDLDVRAELAPFPLDKPVQLPAGDYVLLYRAKDGGVRSRRFAVRVGERTDVRLDG